jgi:RNA polymerase sigma factor (sigma-70 family)
MLTQEEAKELMDKLLALRAEDPNSKAYKRQERLCMEKFSYIVNMKTAPYKSYSNYEDLGQEGLVALSRGLTTYTSERGSSMKNGATSIFWWLNHYVGTKVSRRASLHTTIRFPLSKAKALEPRRESVSVNLSNEFDRPDHLADRNDLARKIRDSVLGLPEVQRDLVSEYFGLSGDSKTVDQICAERGMSRGLVLRQINKGLKAARQNLAV